MKNWEVYIFFCLFRVISSIGSIYYLSSSVLPEDKMFSRKWKIFSGILILGNMICAFIFPQGIFSFVAEMLWIAGLAMWFFCEMIFKNMFALIKLILFIGIRKTLSFYILFSFLPKSGYVFSDDVQYFFLFLIIEHMLFFVFLTMDLAVGKTMRSRMRNRTLPFYLFLPLYQLFLLILYLKNYQEINHIMIYTGTLILILNISINFVLMFSLDKLIEKIEIEEKLIALYTQRQVEYDYCQLANKNMEDIEKLKQYYFSQYQSIRDMLKENPNNPEIRTLIHFSQEQVSQNPFPRFCDEEVVNAVLTLKKQMAEAEQIHMNISVLLPKIISVSALDLCSLFCNLLDNAIEACRRNTTISGYITVKADIVRGGYLIIKTENPCEQLLVRDNHFFRTSKENASEHGYGLKLIEQIAEKYHGKVSAKQEQTRFIVSVLMNLTEG